MIKIFPMYWSLFLLIEVVSIMRILAKYESEVINKNSVKGKKSYSIDTHFLFNSITTIMYFCRVDGNKARELLLGLGDYLRYFLSHEDNNTKLSEEYKVIKGYLNIQRERFGENIYFDIEELKKDCIVNRGFLLDIVHLILKQGILKCKNGGKIVIKSFIDDECINITLVHDGNTMKVIEEYRDIFFEKNGYKLQSSLIDGDKTKLNLMIPLNNIL